MAISLKFISNHLAVVCNCKSQEEGSFSSIIPSKKMEKVKFGSLQPKT